MELLDVLEALGGGYLVPEIDHDLIVDVTSQISHVLCLAGGPVVVLAVVDHLGHQGVDPVSGELGHLSLDLRVPVQDVLSTHDQLVVLHEVLERDGCLDSDESLTDRVEARRASVLQESGVLKADVQTMPRGRVRTHGAGIHGAGIDPEMLRMLPDEVDGDRVQLSIGPGDEVIHGGTEIGDPEPTEQGWVHLLDGVLSTHVNCRDDSGLRVEAIRNSVLVVAKLPVQDQLEEALLDARKRPI